MTIETYIMWVVMPIICLSLLIVVFRFVKGPYVVDRVIALDLIITSGVGLIGAFSILSNDSTFLDTSMILALIGFLSTVAFANYLEKGNKND